jgi:hypothetical protein
MCYKFTEKLKAGINAPWNLMQGDQTYQQAMQFNLYPTEVGV